MEIVDDLSEDSSPVDGVDCSEVVGGIESRVGKERLDDVLWKRRRLWLVNGGAGSKSQPIAVTIPHPPDSLGNHQKSHPLLHNEHSHPVR